jgi:hypothetical protein
MITFHQTCILISNKFLKAWDQINYQGLMKVIMMSSMISWMTYRVRVKNSKSTAIRIVKTWLFILHNTTIITSKT